MRPLAGHPSAQTLKKGLPDLAVENLRVRYHAGPGQSRLPAVVTATVHNRGVARSLPTRLYCSLRAGKHRDEKKIMIPALRGGAHHAVKWSTSLIPGENTFVLRIEDPNNPANNQASKTVRIRPQQSNNTGRAPVQGIGHPGAAEKGSPFATPVAPVRPMPRNRHPDLTVSQIIFNDFKAKKPGETWVQVKIRNIGAVASPKTWLLGTLKRADGTVERNRLPVPALAPRQSTTIEGAMRMTPGLNSLAVEVRDPGTPGNNRMTRRHRFSIGWAKAPGRLAVQKISAGKQVPGQSGKVHFFGAKKETSLSGQSVPRHLVSPVPYGGSDGPDLYIYSTKIIPEHPKVGDTVQVEIRVANKGGHYADPAATIQVQMDVHGPLGSEPVPVMHSDVYLAPFSATNDSIPFRFSYQIPVAGIYTNHVTVDFLSRVREVTRANNTTDIAFNVRPLPDLVVYINRPADVRTGGPKRWFYFCVKNIGEARSETATLKLHIDEDGTHSWEVPPLDPGETFPPNNAMKKRGIRWWRKGRKHYFISVNPYPGTFEESSFKNNAISDTLNVYLPKVHFDPKATIINPAKMYLKKHADLLVGRPEQIVFQVINSSTTFLTIPTKFSLHIKSVGDSGEGAYHFQKSYLYDPLMPGEKKSIVLQHTFDYATTLEYTIKVFRKKRSSWSEIVAAGKKGRIEIKARLGVPVSGS
jgi:hypothetical protein